METRSAMSGRPLGLAAAFALGIFGVAACGGGGGGGGGDDRPPTTLPVYNFSITNGPDTPDALGLSATVDGAPYAIDVDFGTATFSGSYTVASGAYTVFAGTSFSVQTDLATPLLGDFNVQVIENIAFGTGDFPASGAWEVLYLGDTIRATVVSNPSAGVSLQLTDDAPVFYDWNDFEEVFDFGDDFPAWQQVASGAYTAITIALEQSDLVIASLEIIDSNLASGPLATSCDAIPGIPPAGVLSQGETVLTWLGSGDVSPGDSFEWTFTDCWLDDPGDTFDTLVRGSITLRNWTEVVDSSNRLVRIGFEPFNGPGGVQYNDLALDETVESPPGTVTIAGGPGSLVIAGGFAIVFFEP